MKRSRKDVQSRAHALPTLQFEKDQRLTSFAGLVLLQAYFAQVRLLDRLRGCFRACTTQPIFGHARVVLWLIVHLWLGYRRLRDCRYYRSDPMVLRLLGLRTLPDVSTISRTLASADPDAIDRLRRLIRELVLEGLAGWGQRCLTLDFDGSVLSTGRAAEGTAVGFNRKKKGARSYYPLLCTVAQTGQVLDFLHRPGNSHDSQGARTFIAHCLQAVRAVLPHVRIEARLDSAFFSDELVGMLTAEGVEFTISVPFERFAELKQRIESRKRWRRLDETYSFFEIQWAPKSWECVDRFLLVRRQVKRQHKGPLQLDLFVPVSYEHEYQVVVTNKAVSAKSIVAFHHGRGSQEGLFAELKSHCQGDYVPTRRLVGNQIFLASAILTHNLHRDLQRRTGALERHGNAKRRSLWQTETIESFRRKSLQRAGRLTRPRGELTLTMSAEPAVQEEILHRLEVLREAS